jgi:hypothetical protein
LLLEPVRILATREAEIRRITVQSSQPREIVHKILFKKEEKKTLSYKRTGGVHQGVGPEFKPQYQTNKKP